MENKENIRLMVDDWAEKEKSREGMPPIIYRDEEYLYIDGDVNVDELALLADKQGYLRGSMDTADKLSQWLEHDMQCILSQFSQGEPTSDGGYRQMYSGKWYQTNPIDERPKCDCGLGQAHDAISKLKEKIESSPE